MALMNLNTATVNVSASTTSASGAIPALGATTVRVYNPTSAVAYCRTGSSTVAALTTDMPIGAGTSEAFSVNPTDTHFATILSTGTGTISASFSYGGE
jgi:hypothetical protein